MLPQFTAVRLLFSISKNFRMASAQGVAQRVPYGTPGKLETPRNQWLAVTGHESQIGKPRSSMAWPNCWQFCQNLFFFEVHHRSSHIPQRALRHNWQLLPGAECSFGVLNVRTVLEASFAPCTKSLAPWFRWWSLTMHGAPSSLGYHQPVALMMMTSATRWMSGLVSSFRRGYSFSNCISVMSLCTLYSFSLCQYILFTGTSRCCIYVHMTSFIYHSLLYYNIRSLQLHVLRIHRDFQIGPCEDGRFRELHAGVRDWSGPTAKGFT